MTSRFPAPWRIVDIPSGFAVEDATGVQLGVFYGRADRFRRQIRNGRYLGEGKGGVRQTL